MYIFCREGQLEVPPPHTHTHTHRLPYFKTQMSATVRTGQVQDPRELAQQAHEVAQAELREQVFAQAELREQGWWEEHPEDTDEEDACDDCGTTTRPVRCRGCAECEVFVCVPCVREHAHIPSCLVNFEEAVEEANARIPVLLESLKGDDTMDSVRLSQSFSYRCNDADFVTWIKYFVRDWENQGTDVQFVLRATECAGRKRGRSSCAPDGPGISYGLGLGRIEMQCLACIIQKCLVSVDGARDHITRNMHTVEFKGKVVVAYLPPPTSKSARKH